MRGETMRLPRGVVQVWLGGRLCLGYNHGGKGSAFANPLFHLRQYGLGNPMVQEAIRLGAYDAFCLNCRGERMVWKHPGFMCRECASETNLCRVACPECEGSGLRPELPVCEQDLLTGDRESRAVARAMGIEIDDRMQIR